MDLAIGNRTSKDAFRALNSLDEIQRDSLVNSKGVPYKEFKRTLKPKLGVVWMHLATAYLVLVVATTCVMIVDRHHAAWWPVAVVGASLIYGYTLAYIQLFFHEAAHYNIARDRKQNDRLANLFIGTIVGQEITSYRPVHFDHHRYLGTTHDTERTYFDPLNLRFVVESLTGIKPVKVLAKREQLARAKKDAAAANSQVDAKAPGTPTTDAAAKGVVNAQLLMGMAANGAIVLGSILFGYWHIAAAWVIGMIIVYPFFAAVRQVLEHRSEEASAAIDYASVDHGVVNRMFGAGPVASTLGGAGFNRHMLHHWDPQISYTCLADLERFLMDTAAADLMRARRTTYARTFIRLFNR